MRLPLALAALAVALTVSTAAAQPCHPTYHPCNVHTYLPHVWRDPSPTPTRTPTPTATPLPSPTPLPSFRHLSGQAVCTAFRRAGLEAGGCFLEPMAERGIVPHVCDSWRFLIPSLGEDSGGRIYDCPDAEDLGLIVEYHVAVCDRFPTLCPHRYQRANVFVMINVDLPEGQARRYRDVLYGMAP